MKTIIHPISRRKAIKAGAVATAAFTIVPRHVLGGQGQTPPSEKLNIAGVGVGGMGSGDIRSVASENMVALCDVDGRDRRRARSSCRLEPFSADLAARDSASARDASGAEPFELGPLARPGPRAPVSSGLSSFLLARLVGFWNRRFGRYRLPPVV